jgi:lipopolysaccharide/colanic/teichoic acid biosynthesis glycosyltransferase
MSAVRQNTELTAHLRPPVAMRAPELSRVHLVTPEPVVAVEPPTRAAFALQRMFDLTLAVVALLLFALPALVIAVAVKVTSSGPVLFKQQRVGRNGELFSVYKFRTMRDGTHAEVLNASTSCPSSSTCCVAR